MPTAIDTVNAICRDEPPYVDVPDAKYDADVTMTDLVSAARTREANCCRSDLRDLLRGSASPDLDDAWIRLKAMVYAKYKELGYEGACTPRLVCVDLHPSPQGLPGRKAHPDCMHYMHGAIFRCGHRTRTTEVCMPVFSIEQGCVTQREHNRIHDFLGACPT